MLLRSLMCFLLLGSFALPGQSPLPVRDAAELQQMLDKLQVVGNVLYVAAHPDDENTAVLTYFSRGRKLRAAYLSITRGGGGQDLIGPELDDSLAAIRTQELLAARRVDGSEQFFTRAVDFGYSKTTEESLAIWGREAVLSDVVWVIRKFRPDVIITRFSPNVNAGHGHHSASVVLALEAFKAAADPKRFPEQLKRVKPWQAKRLFWNSYHFDGNAVAPGTGIPLDIGQYDPLLGKSYAELAAESRSMHRSQGFGAVASRGSFQERFELLAGESAKTDLFEGIDQTWRRIPGGGRVGELLTQARQAYRPEEPEAVLPLLLQAKQAMDALPLDPWVEVKAKDLIEAIRCAAGIWVEAIADRQCAAPGTKLSIAAMVVARGNHPVTLSGISLPPLDTRSGKPSLLVANKPANEKLELTLPAGMPCSQPVWLKEPRVGGRHGPVPMESTGMPEGAPALTARFGLQIDGQRIPLESPVQYRFRDPVLGERYQPFVVTPRVMVNLAEPVQVFGESLPRDMSFNLIAGADQVSGQLIVQLPSGWKAEPTEIPFTLAKAAEELKLTTRITPPPAPQSGELKASITLDGETQPALGLVRINYPHIPLQTLFPPATGKVVRMDLHHNGRRIGYIMGAGDEIPKCLRLLGYDVELLTDEDLAAKQLSVYDAIVVGIRAFNTRPRLAQLNNRLLDYVAQGGNEVVLYNVAGGGFLAQGMVTESIGPYPLHISRDRVTDETAPMRFLAPEHPLLNWPNKITQADFGGWVQERGLYFADTWDARYTPIFSTQDPGEKATEGSLLVAKHGKGHFIYTGLAFFRQLPDGVPGAYRLFANLLAMGKQHE